MLTLPSEPPYGFNLRCAACPACCKTVRVPLTHFDLARLTRSTPRSPLDLVEWLSPEVIDMTGEPESFVVLREGRRLMTLPHRNGACEWLDSAGLCSVYAARPASCAAYPYTLSELDSRRRLAVLEDSPCSVAREGGQALSNPADEAHRLEAAAQVQRELVVFVALVSQWNRRQRRRRFAGRCPLEPADFIAFALSHSTLSS
ncbi:MAG: YkgJ family cysteine cluster protein [Polyangiaceae bacterium]